MNMLTVVCTYVFLFCNMYLVNVCVWGERSIHQRGDNKRSYEMTYITIIVTKGRITYYLLLMIVEL